MSAAAAKKLHDALAGLDWRHFKAADVVEVITDAVAERLGEFDARIALLERADGMRVHRGVYSFATKYEKGNYCTHSGSTWVAMEEISGSPPGHGWVLTAKRGRDA